MRFVAAVVFFFFLNENDCRVSALYRVRDVLDSWCQKNYTRSLSGEYRPTVTANKSQEVHNFT